ncbi:MAG TPA: adventurous gliding motility protein CglE, partial [Myxococcaceae bacterium]|nr:adventurous gliding motility protein CglE [Myxococcaceae bacterium]
MLGAAPSALAQEAAPPIKEREVTVYHEVERGWYLRGSGGGFFLNRLPATQGPTPFSTGQMAQVELGADLGEHLALGLFVMGTSNRAGSDYIGRSGGSASGDFSAIVPGVVARFSLAGIPDANDVKRTWFYLRGGAGYAKFYPSALLAPDALLFAGPGIEYFTRIRHFSIGFEV